MNSIRTRILSFFIIFALASALAIWMSSRSTQDIAKAAGQVVTHHLPMVHALGQMEVSLNRMDNEVYRYLTTGKKEHIDAIEKERIQFMRWFAEVNNWAREDLEKDKLLEIDEWYNEYSNQTRQLILIASKTNKEPRELMAISTESLEKIQNAMDQIVYMRQGMTVVLKDQINQTLERNQVFTVYFPIIFLVFFVALAFYLWRFLVKPISLLLDGIRNFTRGKGEVHVPSMGKDELGELQEAFNEMSQEISVERKQLRSESQSDSLTGLFNMRYFRRQMGDEFSRSKRYSHPLALLMIDVDHFKNYNDKNGHPAGDIVLKEVARILTRNVRGTDVVARYGGEEFVVLLPETPVESAVLVAEKIRKTVESHHFPYRETQVGERVTISVGIGAYPDPMVTSDQALVESADKALYAAKQTGRNRVYIFMKGNIKPTTEPLPDKKKTASR